MKVLEKGSGWNLEKRCTGVGNGEGGCNSKLLIEPQDIYSTSHIDYLGDKEYYYTFQCPICGVETDIDPNQIPYSIKEKAKNEGKSKYARTLSRNYSWR